VKAAALKKNRRESKSYVCIPKPLLLHFEYRGCISKKISENSKGRREASSLVFHILHGTIRGGALDLPIPKSPRRHAISITESRFRNKTSFSAGAPMIWCLRS